MEEIKVTDTQRTNAEKAAATVTARMLLLTWRIIWTRFLPPPRGTGWRDRLKKKGGTGLLFGLMGIGYLMRHGIAI